MLVLAIGCSAPAREVARDGGRDGRTMAPPPEPAPPMPGPPRVVTGEPSPTPADPMRVAPLVRVWEARISEGSAATVFDATAVAGVSSEMGSPAVMLVDARTGATRWRLDDFGHHWYGLRAGRQLAVLSGRRGGSALDEVGVLSLADGRILSKREVERPASPMMGEDGTGAALSRRCDLTPFDPATGAVFAVQRGRTARLGHMASDGSTSMEELCTQEPRLLGQVGDTAVVLRPAGVADVELAGVGAGGQRWVVPLGRSDSRPEALPAEGVVWTVDHVTLNVVRVDLASGHVLWRRRFARPDCMPAARDAGGGLLVVQACPDVTAIGVADGRDRFQRDVGAARAVLVGEALTPYAQEWLWTADAPVDVQWLARDGRALGRFTMPARSRAVPAGDLLIVRDEQGFEVRGADGVRRFRHELVVDRLAAQDGLALVKLIEPRTQVVVDLASGAFLGREETMGTLLAVLPGPTFLLRAGLLMLVRPAP